MDKIISMGLVSERKDLYKKRRRSTAGKSRGMTEEDFLADLSGEPGDDMIHMDEEENEELEEDEEDDDDEGEKEEIRPVRERKVNRRESVLEKNLSVGSMAQSLRGEGMSGPILWLQNCLNRAADDREEDGVSHPVALVPLTEENEDAMENKKFQRLLRKVGIRAPADEQESFWRIPATMSIYQLRSIAASLDQAEESEVTVQEETDAGMTANPELAQNNEEGHDSQELRAQALRALLLARQRKHSSEDTKKDSFDVEATSESGAQSAAAVEGKTSGKRSRVLDSDDDDEDETGEASPSRMNVETEGGNQSDEETHSAPAKRRRHRVLSDDEEDD
ncbi:hypothetical protein PGIGA_G00120000 [Pangasianodon gigas]|uniref:Uncharacterized protein n=1 Tax=Pangasianodon gigas TaxID=30993 RepID=A0ACC5XFV9_PANGG|nr:hypothetical protein [Pangasianodon gigas]